MSKKNNSQSNRSYQLLDCGNGRKLEQFGAYVLDRPEPRAYWLPNWSDKQWRESTDARFEQTGKNTGSWEKKGNIPSQWLVEFQVGAKRLKFECKLTKFKHVGIFPEHHSNWEFIARETQKGDKILNLFAYTGGASLAAAVSGGDVTHVESVKQVISWARQNMESSQLSGIRWMAEDALTYVKREVKRGKKYKGIILDPPAFGLGKNGKRWVMEDQINDLLSDLSRLLQPGGFLVLNLYSVKTSSSTLYNLVHRHFNSFQSIDYGETLIESASGFQMPAGFTLKGSGLKSK
jgi:23S rRNA (cytosine1962-C5)-methyltransferase